MALGTYGPRGPRGKLCHMMILPYVISVALATRSWSQQEDLEVQEPCILQHQRQKKPSSFDFAEAHCPSKTHLVV